MGALAPADWSIPKSIFYTKYVIGCSLQGWTRGTVTNSLTITYRAFKFILEFQWKCWWQMKQYSVHSFTAISN